MSTKEFAPSNLRNIVLVGHGGCGKTSLAEAMLFLTGANRRLGVVLDQTATMDFEPEEHKRGGSVATSLAWVEHAGTKINILDTPGDQSFIYDSFNAMLGADGAVIVLSAPDGVEVQTEAVYGKAVELGMPRVAFITKMDRDRADHEQVLQDMKASFGVTPVAVQIPMGSQSNFTGVVDLFAKKALIFKMDGSGKYESTDIPAAYADAVDMAWESLVEEVAGTDDELMEKYLEHFELSEEDVKAGFRAAIGAGTILPVLYGAGTSCVGALRLLDLVGWAFPAPIDRGEIDCENDGELDIIKAGKKEPFAAQVIHTTIDEQAGKLSLIRIFSGTIPSDNLVRNTSRRTNERIGSAYALRGKERESLKKVISGDIIAVPKLKDTRTGDTLAGPKASITLNTTPYPSPMMAYVMTPKSKKDEDKIKVAVERLLEEDPTLSVAHEQLTHQMVLQGMGQAHLDAVIARMKRKYGVTVDTSLPPVPYRETIKCSVRHIEGRHKKQTGGAGQFGVCLINVEPCERGGGFKFIDKISGGAIPRQYIPSVEKGLRERMGQGFMAGYPIIDIQVELVDGKYHPVDSKDVAFQMAGSKGLKAAFEKAGTVLLEPIYLLEIMTPSDKMGDIMGDINSRRGRVLGMEHKGKNTVIRAQAPLAEMQTYAPDINAMTGGKGSFTMELTGYEEVPNYLVKKVVQASPFQRNSEE